MPRVRSRLIRSVLAASLLLAMAFVTTTSAEAARIALLIGNSAYQHVPMLANPRNDVALLANTLQRIGFDKVVLKNDLTYEQVRATLRAFAAEAATADVATVYYAGHGIEIGGQNYVIPVDARLASDRDVAYEAVPIDLLLQAVEGSSKLRLVVLDACRNNPFASRVIRTGGAGRSIGRGLGYIEPGSTLVIYAAKHGQEAADGVSGNSPFTKALVKHIETPGLDVGFMFRRVRDEVLGVTKGRQEPFSYGSLSGEDLFLVPPRPTAQPTIAPDVAAWLSIKDRGGRAEIERYLQEFPNGAFAEEARTRLATAVRPDANARLEVEKSATPSADLRHGDTIEPAAGKTSAADDGGGILGWLRRNMRPGDQSGDRGSENGAGGGAGGGNAGGGGGGGGGRGTD